MIIKPEEQNNKFVWTLIVFNTLRWPNLIMTAIKKWKVRKELAKEAVDIFLSLQDEFEKEIGGES